MKKNIEIEFKTLLSESDFTRLKDSYFKGAVLIEQQNRYFDTVTNDLYDRKMTARIRRANNRSLFTLKQVNQDNQVVEYEIEDEKLQIDDPRITELLVKLNLPLTIIEIAKTTTDRLIIEDNAGEWCLDKTQFSNTVDYELEYELTKDTLDERSGLDRFTEFLETYEIVYKHGPSKFQRALSY